MLRDLPQVDLVAILDNLALTARRAVFPEQKQKIEQLVLNGCIEYHRKKANGEEMETLNTYLQHYIPTHWG